MTTGNVAYRRPLNDQQLEVLQWLYIFRFCNSKQIACHLGKATHKAIQRKLQILEDQNIIGKRYDKSYKLAGRPAAYYLTPKGAKKLTNVNVKVHKGLYKNKTASDDFVTHTMAIVDVALQLQAIYGDQLKLFSKSLMVPYSYIPHWTPDLFVSLQIGNDKAQRQRYFLDAWDTTKPFFLSVRKARNYITFNDTGEWLQGYDFPAILAVCQDTKHQKKLNRQLKKALDESYEEEIVFATTTVQQMDESLHPSDAIWLKISSDDEPRHTSLLGLHSPAD